MTTQDEEKIAQEGFGNRDFLIDEIEKLFEEMKTVPSMRAIVAGIIFAEYAAFWMSRELAKRSISDLLDIAYNEKEEKEKRIEIDKSFIKEGDVVIGATQ